MNKCPNCGKNPPRKQGAVLCQECVDTCPQGPTAALRIEEVFLKVLPDIKLPHDEHPYGIDWK